MYRPHASATDRPRQADRRHDGCRQNAADRVVAFRALSGELVPVAGAKHERPPDERATGTRGWRTSDGTAAKKGCRAGNREDRVAHLRRAMAAGAGGWRTSEVTQEPPSPGSLSSHSPLPHTSSRQRHQKLHSSFTLRPAMPAVAALHRPPIWPVHPRSELS